MVNVEEIKEKLLQQFSSLHLKSLSEDSLYKKLFNTYKDIGNNLNRTCSAVQNKCKKMGLKKPDKYFYNHRFFQFHLEFFLFS